MVASLAVFPSHPETASLQVSNRALLEAMGRSTHRRAWLRWRNALITTNLPLVRMVAERQRQRCNEPFEDLVSMGVLGLIRAVEAFDLNRNGRLSSFAVPYIRGAILHGLRDQSQGLHTPRRLRELHQRVRRHQDLLRAAGQPLPSLGELAAELGCTTAQLEEAAAVQRALRLRSLDAPCSGPGDETDGACLIDQVSAPPPPPADPQRAWLHRQLAVLTPRQQRLLVGHWIEGLSWRQLAQELGEGVAETRRQGEALLAMLQRAAGQPTSSSQPMARAAATAV
jgi:RNA polymerase sigma-B factor